MRLPVVDNDVLVFDVETVKQLRGLGIVGNFIGTAPQAPQQNNFLVLPLRLTPYEVIWLVQMGIATLIDGTDFPKHYRNTKVVNGPYHVIDKGYSSAELSTTEVSLQRFWHQVHIKDYRIFKVLKLRGYWMLPGLKFGGKFVAYPGDPMMFHSHLIVESGDVTFTELVVSGRLATGVKKLYITSDLDSDDDQEYKGKVFSIEWARFG